MIVQEHFESGGRELVRTYSDEGRYVVGGDPYGEYIEAVDLAEFNRQYVEGDQIEKEEEEASFEEIVNILLGVKK